nr:hypothetical protein [Solemya velesiana gill symbiont]
MCCNPVSGLDDTAVLLGIHHAEKDQRDMQFLGVKLASAVPGERLTDADEPLAHGLVGPEGKKESLGTLLFSQ